MPESSEIPEVAARTAALRQYHILDSEPEEAYDRIVDLAIRILDLPIATITFLDQDRVWHKASHGFDRNHTGNEPGLFTAAGAGKLHVVEDAYTDPVAAWHPLVTGPPHLRFFAAAPLTLNDITIGTLSVADTAPCTLTTEQKTALESLAAIVADMLASRNQSNQLGVLRASLSSVREKAVRLATIIDTLPEAVFTTALDGEITSWNPAAEQTYGFHAGDIIGQHVSVLSPNESEIEIRRVLARIAANETVEPFETLRMEQNSYIFEAVDSISPILDRNSQVTGAAWTSRNVSDLRRLEAIVWDEKERAEVANGLIADAVITADVEGRLVYLNPAAEQLTGQTTARCHGLPVRKVVPLVHRESEEAVESPIDTCLREAEPVEFSSYNMLRTASGGFIPVDDAAAPIRDRDGAVCGAVMVLRMAASHRHDQIPGSSYVASRDPVTGLITRRELEHRIEQALVTAARENTSHALLYINLNHYRDFVESYGNVAGDELLKQIAVMLRTQVRDMDSLARMRDDEFCLLLSHCPLTQAQRIAVQLRKTIRDFPFCWQQKLFEVFARIGGVPITPDSGSSANVLHLAEFASRMADTEGLDQINILPVSDINQIGRSRRAKVMTISRAMAEERFLLYGQKIQPLTADGVYGEQCEMLLHLVDDEGNVVPSAVFLSAAERDEMLTALDRWVVRHVFEMLRDHPNTSISSWTINLSEASLHDETFADYVREQFSEYDIPPQLICFEFDETVAINNLGQATQLIDELRRIGYAFCLSHFGTSLNTFAYLRNLNVDYIKVDSSIVRNITNDPVNREIASSICHVAHTMGIRTIAEMVEEENILSYLKSLGFDYAQGFAIAEPFPIHITT